MPLNTTRKERAEQAAIDLNQKLRLESATRARLNELFRQMRRDLESVYSETGQSINAENYADDVRGILAAGDRRTAEAFTGRITDFIEENSENEDDTLIAALVVLSTTAGKTLNELVTSMKRRVRNLTINFVSREIVRDTASIVATNQVEIDSAIASAISDESNTTREKIGRSASRDFGKRAKQRASTIAATTTQKIAEGVKQIERDEFFEMRNGFSAIADGIPQIDEREVWVTVGDSRVREAHIEADETEKVDGFFSVGGELLRYPGDENGSAANTINCRCSAQTRID